MGCRRLRKKYSVNYPGLDYIISDVYEMYNALCSYGFQEPIEVVKNGGGVKKIKLKINKTEE